MVAELVLASIAGEEPIEFRVAGTKGAAVVVRAELPDDECQRPAISVRKAFVGFRGFLTIAETIAKDFALTVIRGGITMSAGSSRNAWR